MLDYINTNTFRDVAHFRIMPTELFTHEILKKNAILFCKTDFIPQLFNHLQFTNRRYVLITHSSDLSIDGRLFNARPKCIVKWYAENVKYVHPDLVSIPIGLTPNRGPDKTILDLDWFLSNIETLRSNPKDTETLYCNWNTRNFPQKRAPVLEKLEKAGMKYVWDYPDFPSNVDVQIQEKMKLIERGEYTNRELNDFIHYYEYCDHLSRHKFVVAPPGNGDGDTHRVWESLYVGCFPIVLKSPIFNDYKDDLPIIQVNDYSELSYDLLNSYLDREFNTEKLHMTYWKKRIEKDFENL